MPTRLVNSWRNIGHKNISSIKNEKAMSVSWLSEIVLNTVSGSPSITPVTVILTPSKHTTHSAIRLTDGYFSSSFEKIDEANRMPNMPTIVPKAAIQKPECCTNTAMSCPIVERLGLSTGRKRLTRRTICFSKQSAVAVDCGS